MKVQLLDETHECHPACAGATREQCVCVCEGRFHGAHWVSFRAKVAADLDAQGGVMAVMGRRGGLAPADDDDF